MAFRIASNLWWEATEDARLAPCLPEVTGFLLSLMSEIPRSPLATSWIQGAWQYAMSTRDTQAGYIGLVLQRWLFEQQRWEESWAVGRILRREQSGSNVALSATIGMGSAYCALEQSEEATFYYETAAQEWTASQGLVLLSHVHHGLSASLAQLRQWDQAAAHAEQAYELYRVVQSDRAHEALHNLGLIRGYQKPDGIVTGLKILESVAEHYESVGDVVRLRAVLADCVVLATATATSRDSDWRLYQRRLDAIAER